MDIFFFCIRQFALHRQQPEKYKQNVDFAPLWKNFCGRPWWGNVKSFTKILKEQATAVRMNFFIQGQYLVNSLDPYQYHGLITTKGRIYNESKQNSADLDFSKLERIVTAFRRFPKVGLSALIFYS